jgi:signal peptidase I
MAEASVSGTRSRRSSPTRRSWQQVWRDWRWFVAVLAGMLVFRSVVADWNQVPTGSMLPTISVGDQIVVDKRAYDLRIPFTHLSVARWADPQRGDIVTFPSPLDGRLYVKRVIGLPGDTVAMRDNVLAINGAIAQHTLLSDEGMHLTYRETLLGSAWTIQLLRAHASATMTSFGPVMVPQGAYLVLGDNRDESFDSRAIGLIARDSILGRARAVAFSLDYDAGFELRSERVLETLR